MAAVRDLIRLGRKPRSRPRRGLHQWSSRHGGDNKGRGNWNQGAEVIMGFEGKAIVNWPDVVAWRDGGPNGRRGSAITGLLGSRWHALLCMDLPG